MKKMIKTILLILFCLFLSLIILFPYFFSLNWVQVYNFHKYGHIQPYNYVGMTRAEVFDRINKNRVIKGSDRTMGKIAIATGDGSPVFFDNIDQVLSKEDSAGNKVFFKWNDIAVNYFYAFGIHHLYLLHFENDVVVSQKLVGSRELLSWDFLFPHRDGSYGGERFN